MWKPSHEILPGSVFKVINVMKKVVLLFKAFPFPYTLVESRNEGRRDSNEEEKKSRKAWENDMVIKAAVRKEQR